MTFRLYLGFYCVRILSMKYSEIKAKKKIWLHLAYFMTGSALSQFLLHFVKSADNAYVQYFGRCMGVIEEE